MKTKFLIQAAVIAAVYAALTLALAPFSYLAIQVRVSEALTVLPLFTPAAIPGLFIGCLVANIMSPIGMVDLVFGSLASLAAAWLSYLLREKPMLVPLPPVLINGVVIGAILYYVYGVKMPLLLCMGCVSAGQFISCYIIGYPLMKVLMKYKRIFE